MTHAERYTIAFEAFIRRAAEVDDDFILKGSLVTRQYFENPADRIPADLDWVYIKPLSNQKQALRHFNEWADDVTRINKHDGVVFRRFSKNAFWREMDYAMSEDFPTVNTDILCWVDGKEVAFGMDLSFNLPIDYPPTAIIYAPIRGEEFYLPNTVPLCLQVSWKLHQTLVRPRFKDFLDLIHLVQHENFTPTVMSDTLQALADECAADFTGAKRIEAFLSEDYANLFGSTQVMEEAWEYWRYKKGKAKYSYDRAKDSVEPSTLPEQLSDFLDEFKRVMKVAGIHQSEIKQLPPPRER